MTVVQLAINWIISQPGVKSAIVGARNPVEMREDTSAADFLLTREQLHFVHHEFEELGQPM